MKCIVTGISGSGRIELLDELCDYATSKGKKVITYNLSQMIRNVCIKNNISMVDESILDIDLKMLKVLRTSAIKDLEKDISKHEDYDLFLIGVHATFRWKNQLIPGFSCGELYELKPDRCMNIVGNVNDIYEDIRENPKWNDETIPTVKEIQYWMMEEEFATNMLADVLRVPMFLIAREHKISNLYDLFFSKKKKVYLSYPITAIRESNPDLLRKIQGLWLKRLEEKFVVFNPLSIKDMALTYPSAKEKYPKLVEQITAKDIEIIKKRTIVRDYQFIDQSDGIVVFYFTDKLSPGVFAEINYAHRNQKKVFMAMSGKHSPFIENMAHGLEDNLDSLFEHLEEFAMGTEG